MKLDPHALAALLSSRDFKLLPSQLAMEQLNDGWEQVIRQTLTYARHTCVWEACHRIAELLELYPQIQEVSLDFSIGHDDDPYLDTQVKVNGQRVSAYSRTNTLGTVPGAEKIDGGERLCQSVQWLENIGTMKEGRQAMYEEINAFSAAFEEPIFSPQQARELAREHSPTVESWVRQRVLEDLVADGAKPDHETFNAPRM